MSDQHYQTKPEDVVFLGQKLIYGLGGFANCLLGTASQGLTIALNLGLGMDPAKIGLLGALPRITDALTDPMMGYISDNTRSRWGRRRPYIFVGAIFCGLLFTLLWMLPSTKDTHFMIWELPEAGSLGRDAFIFWYFLLGSIVFYAAYTVWVTPWVALGYELTPDYHERTRVMGWSNFVGQLAYLVTPWFLWFMQRDIFGDIMTGAAYLAFFISLVVVAIGIISAIFLEERFYEGLKARDEANERLKEVQRSFWASMLDFFKGFGSVIRFKPFLLLCSTAFLIFNGFMLVSSFTIYVIIYHVCQGDQAFGGELSGLGGTISAACAFIIVYVVTKLGTTFGKKKAFYITTSISVVGYLSKWWFLTPNYPYLSLIPGPLIAFGFGGLFPLVGAMIADVCDLDELNTKERREGMFGSIFWWVIKVGMAAALAGGGYLLNATGFDVALESQSPDTVYWLRVFDVLVPAATSLLAIYALSKFELTEEKAHEVREALEQRRKAEAAVAP
jgi:GPH family glycoside/pentoside/hexuronide:cation symporter